MRWVGRATVPCGQAFGLWSLANRNSGGDASGRHGRATMKAKSSALGAESAASDVHVKDRTFSDGHPLDRVQYLECKLILKPDRFTQAETFLEYGALVGKTAKEFGV